jgi:hypothetical protein
MSTITASSVHYGSSAATVRTARSRRALLACAVAAGPLYVVSGLTQALTRAGFDLTRHPLSLLSNGTLGWIQITTFVVAGVLTVLGAAGLRGHLGSRWAARLVALYGVGLVAAGTFVADPMDGFPVGTPPGPPAVVSWHGMLHFMAGGVGFLGLIGACLVLARRFRRAGRRGWAVYSAVTGVLFTAAFAGIASGSATATLTVAFGVAVVLGWTWLTAVLLDARRANS